MGRRITYAALTNAGGRKENEDSVKVRTGDFSLAAAVADGLGSQGGGAVASQIAVEEAAGVLKDVGRQGVSVPKETDKSDDPDTATEELQVTAEPDEDDLQLMFGRECDKAMLSESEGILSEAGIVRIFERADARIRSCQTDEVQMMATLVALFIDHDKARWAHMGDSRLYHFVDGKLVSVTVDHSVPQMAVTMGMIGADEIRHHPDRSKLLSALGDGSPEPEISDITDVSKGFHAFLLCTDGFWEPVDEALMTKTLDESIRASGKTESVAEKYGNTAGAAVNMADAAKGRNKAKLRVMPAAPEDWLVKMQRYLVEETGASRDEADNYTALAVYVQDSN